MGLGRTRPSQTFCADPSSPHIKDGSVCPAFHCSKLGIMHFGLGCSGCNYSFPTVVFPPDLETLQGHKRVVHVGGLSLLPANKECSKKKKEKKERQPSLKTILTVDLWVYSITVAWFVLGRRILARFQQWDHLWSSLFLMGKCMLT